MAYGRKYYVEFTNVQNDVHIIYISEKDYEGNAAPLRGDTDAAFVTSNQSGDDSIFDGIRAKECTLKFVAENEINLLSFYSEDDERFRIDHYIHSINGNVIDKLIASYFIVQDSCEQDYAAEPFSVTLKGTDNIALLKDVAFTTAGMPYNPTTGTPYLGDISLFDFIKIIIQQTGLYDLPLRIYSNLFENSTNDRSDSPTADMFEETFVSTGLYLNDDSTWKDLYTILTDLTTTFLFKFFQDNGAWNIVRQQESTLFSEFNIAGVEHDLATGYKTAISLDYSWPVAFVPDENFREKIFFDKADQVLRIQRPFSYVKETFDYKQPSTFIDGSDLKLPAGATAYETNTVAGIKTDKYSIATYFPTWIERGSIPSHLEITTDTNLIPATETDRYIVVDGVSSTEGGIQFNPFPITKGDVPRISFSIKTLSEVGDAAFWVRFIVFTEDNTFWALARDETITSGSSYAAMRWNGPWPADTWDITAHSPFPELFMHFIYTDSGSVQWMSVDSFNNVDLSFNSLPCPVDGIVLIQVNGTNLLSDARHDMAFKDINLTITQNVNQSTQITGQIHLNTQVAVIKNNYDQDISIDDSPRNTIAGTLFTDALTNFDHTDSTTGAQTDIGNVHFTKTKLWHRSQINEQRRLGEIIVFERMQNAYKVRTIIEGTLYGLRNQLSTGEWNFVCLLCLLSVDSLPDLRFIFGVLEVDWMNATYKAVINELFNVNDTDSPFNYSYIFNYIYKTD